MENGDKTGGNNKAKREKDEQRKEMGQYGQAQSDTGSESEEPETQQPEWQERAAGGDTNNQGDHMR